MSLSKSEPVEWEYCKNCKNCDKHVLGEYSTTSYVGQYGTNVDLVVYCTECDEVIRRKMIDKDI